jgi:hypothetical protein
MGKFENKLDGTNMTKEEYKVKWTIMSSKKFKVKDLYLQPRSKG